MIPRIAKIALVAAVAFFYSLVVFNNLTDFDSNYQFVRHVLMMDSTFPGNHGMWRAINAPALHIAFYLGIIAWEIVTTLLLWWGVARMVAAIRFPARRFHAAKQISSVALTLSLLMWLVAFLAVGGEWFLMWQSPSWNGQDAAARNFAVVALVLLIVAQPEAEIHI
jgi:predicted small integral membrane protein